MADIPWFKVDDGFHAHRKTRQLVSRRALDAIGLWSLCGSWSSAHLEDGFVPDVQILVFTGTQPRARKLVDHLEDVGLAQRTKKDGEAGIQLHDFTGWNPSAAETVARRAAKAEAGRKGAHSRWHGDNGEQQP